MGEHERPAKRSRGKFSDEFKRDAVEIMRSSGKSIAEVARELGIHDSSLGNWVKQDQVDRGERHGLSSDELERELLERAAAFWVGSRTSDALPLRRRTEGRRVPGRANL